VQQFLKELHMSSVRSDYRESAVGSVLETRRWATKKSWFDSWKGQHNFSEGSIALWRSIQSHTEWVPWALHPGVQRPLQLVSRVGMSGAIPPPHVFFYNPHRDNFIALGTRRQRMVGLVKSFTMLYQDYYQTVLNR